MIFNKKEEKEEKKELKIPFSKETSTKNKGFAFTKIKGTTSFIERLKSLSKRDITYLMVGISILVLAPVAQYFFTKPQTDTVLTPGFGERRSSDSAGIYEPGVNALSAGSPEGTDEVIAPLTARDPASLIIGEQKQEPPKLPEPPTETKRDSIADVAKRSFVEAVKSSPAPFIPPKMQSSLRGASSFFGGEESSKTSGNLGGSGKILADAKNAPTQSQKKSMIGAQAIPGYKGVASQTDSVNKGAFEKLKTQADKAAGYFSGANATESLDKAAAASLNPVGSGGLGEGLDGGRNTNPSNSSNRNSFSYSPGDPCRGSIERQLACENARKANDFKNFFKYDLPKSIIQQAVDNIIGKGLLQPIGEKVANTTKGLLNPSGPAPAPKYCWQSATKKVSVIVNKDNNGSVQLIPPVTLNDCPCGFLTTQPDPECSGGSSGSSSGGASAGGGSSSDSGGSSSAGGGSSSGGSNVAGPSGGSQTASETSDIRSELEAFDTYLKEAISAAKTGSEANSIAQLKQYTQKAGENLEQAISKAQNISQSNAAKIDSNGFKKATEYKTAISEVEVKIKTVREEYNTFNNDMVSFSNTLDKAIADYKAGKIKPKLQEGVVAQTLGGSDIPVKLQEAKSKVDKIKEDTAKIKEEYLNKFEQRLKSHNAAYVWYVNQIKISKDTNNKIYSQTGGLAQETKSITAQISQIPDNTTDQGVVNTLKQLFNNLTGLEAQNIAILAPQTMMASLSGDFRMSVDGAGDKISTLIEWRSADKEQAMAGNISDTTAIEQEKKNFDSAKPSEKLSKGEFASNFQNLSMDTSFILPIIRVSKVVEDVGKSKELVSHILEGLDGYNTLLEANKTQLETVKTEIKPLLDQLGPVTTTSPKPKPKPKPKPTTTTAKPTTNNTTIVINNYNIVNITNQQQCVASGFIWNNGGCYQKK